MLENIYRVRQQLPLGEMLLKPIKKKQIDGYLSVFSHSQCINLDENDDV